MFAVAAILQSRRQRSGLHRLAIAGWGTFVFVLALLALPRPGAALQQPQAVVEYVGQQGIAALAPNVPPAQRLALFQQLFANYFDVDTIAAFALGRNRYLATPQQQAEYFRLYRAYTVNSYADKLTQLGQVPFRVTGTRVTGRDAVVSSQVDRGGGPIRIDWYLAANKRGNFKVVDLAINGVSMKVTQRDEFSGWIQNNGGRFDALLAVLRQQTPQIR